MLYFIVLFVIPLMSAIITLICYLLFFYKPSQNEFQETKLNEEKINNSKEKNNPKDENNFDARYLLDDIDIKEFKW